MPGKFEISGTVRPVGLFENLIRGPSVLRGKHVHMCHGATNRHSLAGTIDSDSGVLDQRNGAIPGPI